MSGLAKRALACACALLVVACAQPAATRSAVAPPAQESLLPGTIGIVVQPAPGGVVVAAVREGVTALRPGDRIARYNGIEVTSVRQFNRLVADSPPGSVAELELVRAGVTHRMRLPVRQLDTTPRG